MKFEPFLESILSDGGEDYTWEAYRGRVWNQLRVQAPRLFQDIIEHI